MTTCNTLSTLVPSNGLTMVGVFFSLIFDRFLSISTIKPLINVAAEGRSYFGWIRPLLPAARIEHNNKYY